VNHVCTGAVIGWLSGMETLSVAVASAEARLELLHVSGISLKEGDTCVGQAKRVFYYHGGLRSSMVCSLPVIISHLFSFAGEHPPPPEAASAALVRLSPQTEIRS
jgi:hypothetical protein